MFAKPIEFTFKRETKFGSLCGAWLSLLIRLGVMVYMATRIYAFYLDIAEDMYTTGAEMPDTDVNFEKLGNFQFMIGFNKAFTPKFGKLRVTMDHVVTGRLLA